MPSVDSLPKVPNPVAGQLLGADDKPVENSLYQGPLEVKIIGEGDNKITQVGPIEEDIFKSNNQLVQDEGEVGHIYLDSEGNPTFGIGSLLSSHMGTLLDAGFTKEQIDSHVKKLKEARSRGELPQIAFNYPEEFQLKIPRNVYAKSFKQGLNDASIVFNQYTEGLELPEEAVTVIKNLAYQLGPRLYKFTELKKALKNKDYNKAADEIIKSRLYEQAPKRTQRRADEIRRLAK